MIGCTGEKNINATASSSFFTFELPALAFPTTATNCYLAFPLKPLLGKLSHHTHGNPIIRPAVERVPDSSRLVRKEYKNHYRTFDLQPRRSPFESQKTADRGWRRQ